MAKIPTCLRHCHSDPDENRGKNLPIPWKILRSLHSLRMTRGDIEAGLLAAAVGGPVSVVIGGVGVIGITSLIAYFNPKLRNYQGKELAV